MLSVNCGIQKYGTYWYFSVLMYLETYYVFIGTEQCRVEQKAIGWRERGARSAKDHEAGFELDSREHSSLYVAH